MLSDEDLQNIKAIVDNIVDCNVEEIKTMLRHIHNDVENIRRDQQMLEIRLINVATLVNETAGEALSIADLENYTNLDPDLYSSLNELYSPIDDVDKVAWEEHLIKEKERREESKRLDWND